MLDNKKFIITNEIVCAILSSLLIYTIITKLSNIKMFVLEINIQPFPDEMTKYLAPAIIVISASISVMLLFRKFRRTGILCFLGLMITFSGYIVLVLLGIFDKMPCSCAGMIRSLSWGQHLIFNIVFIVIGIFALYLNKTQTQIGK